LEHKFYAFKSHTRNSPPGLTVDRRRRGRGEEEEEEEKKYSCITLQNIKLETFTYTDGDISSVSVV
jgi:hypothetical protein